MAAIVKRGKSFSVVYTYHKDGKRKQCWETYHSYEAAVCRKEQVEIIRTARMLPVKIACSLFAGLTSDSSRRVSAPVIPSRKKQ